MNFATDFAKPDQGLALWPHDAAPPGDLNASIATAEMRLAMAEFDKICANGFWAFLMSKYDNEEINAGMVKFLIEVEAWAIKQMNGKKFLGGTDEPMAIDIHIVPFLQLPVQLDGSVFDDAYKILDPAKNCPKVQEYVKRFREHPTMAPFVAPDEAFKKYAIKKKSVEGKAALDTEMLSHMFE